LAKALALGENMKRTAKQRERISMGMRNSWLKRKHDKLKAQLESAKIFSSVEEIPPTEHKDVAAEYDFLLAPNGARAFVKRIHCMEMHGFLLAAGIQIRGVSSHETT
jgi:hypothetical protein